MNSHYIGSSDYGYPNHSSMGQYTQGFSPRGTNVTGSHVEEKVDVFASNIQERVQRFESYVSSEDGQSFFGGVGAFGTAACSLIVGSQSPFVFVISIAAGVVFKSMSREQVGAIEDACSRISSKLPTSVKALAVVISHVFFPILFPVSVGLYAGVQVGHHIPPETIAALYNRITTFFGFGETNGDQPRGL